MDSNVISCDVDFGSGSLLSAAPYNAKESPSHQSDSGMSEMSEDRSVTPTSRLETPNFLDVESFSYNNFDNEIDEELQSYFVNPNITDGTTTSSQTYSSSRSQSENSVEVEEKIPQMKGQQPRGSVRVLRGKAHAMKVHEDLIKLNQPKLPTPGEPQKIPAIKVVKVVKPAMGSSKTEIDHQVYQALDERNRKNAIQAKLNREKKKQYVHSLEVQIGKLTNENRSLKDINKDVTEERDSLLAEVDYLKSVLANQSALSGILQNIGNVKSVKLSSSIMRKRSAMHDHDYESTTGKRGPKIPRPAGKQAGVCLHVDNDSVSLEFCSKCAGMAKSALDS